jgi:hypothetical protein
MNANRFFRNLLWLTSFVCGLATIVPAAHGQQTSRASPVLGAWQVTDRHVAMGSLFQPSHGVRARGSVLTLEEKAGQLRGYAIVPGYKEIVSQRDWKDGRTEMLQASFADGRLTLEWEIRKWLEGAGPLAVEEKRAENKGTIRVEAVLKDQRLIGTWKMFLADGTEVYRGEWLAVRDSKETPP